MALKCRCICGCKLLVSAGSAGKRIKCPKCERKLRVPVDVVEKRRAQVESRKAKSKANRKAEPQPTAKRTKIDKPLSSLLDLPDPTPPPLPKDGLVDSRSNDKPPTGVDAVEETTAFERELVKDDKPLEKASETKPPAAEPIKEKQTPLEKIDDNATKVDQKARDEAAELADNVTQAPEKKDQIDNNRVTTTLLPEASKPKSTAPKDKADITKAKEENAEEAARQLLPATTLASEDHEPAKDHVAAVKGEVVEQTLEKRRDDVASDESTPSTDLPTRKTPETQEQPVATQTSPDRQSEPAPKLLPSSPPSETEPKAEEPADAHFAMLDEPPDDIDLPLQGYVPNRDQVATVRSLAAAIMVTGLIGMVPAMIDIIEHLLSQSSDGLSRWASAVLLVGVLQCAYAVYLIQLPDWSSIRVVTVFAVSIAAAYAAMLGLTLLSTDQGHFVQILDLADRLNGGKASAWCLIMLGLMSLAGYFSGRIATRWQSAFTT